MAVARESVLFRGAVILGVGCLLTALACLLSNQQAGMPILALQTSLVSLIRQESGKPCLCAKADSESLLRSARGLVSAQKDGNVDPFSVPGPPQEDRLPPWVTLLPRDPNAFTGRAPQLPVSQICLISERLSGSNWLESTLIANFPGLVTHSCGSFKHWFKSPVDLQSSLTVTDDTMFIVIFRNAVDWMVHFWKKPWNSGSHQNLTLPAFLTKAWVKDDLLAEEVFVDGKDEGKRQEGRRIIEFQEAQAYSNTFDYYEKYHRAYGGDFPAGPIDNIMQLRAMKVDNFLRIKDYIPMLHPDSSPRVIYVRYEDLVADGGAGMLNFIQGLKAHYSFMSTSEDDVLTNNYKGRVKGQEVNITALEVEQVYHSKKTDNSELSKEVIDLLLTGVDFAQEQKLGYHYEFLLA